MGTFNCSRPDHEPKVKLAKIFAKTIRKGGCLEYRFTRSRGDNGRLVYPNIHYKSKRWKGHRLVYFLTHGSIPAGKIICHTCDNMACINPKHLYAGTYLTNVMDIVRRGRHYWASKTHCVNGHPFSKKNTAFGKNKSGRARRICRTCKRAWCREQYAKTKAAVLKELERIEGGT